MDERHFRVVWTQPGAESHFGYHVNVFLLFSRSLIRSIDSSLVASCNMSSVPICLYHFVLRSWLLCGGPIDLQFDLVTFQETLNLAGSRWLWWRWHIRSVKPIHATIPLGVPLGLDLCRSCWGGAIRQRAIPTSNRVEYRKLLGGACPGAGLCGAAVDVQEGIRCLIFPNFCSSSPH